MVEPGVGKHAADGVEVADLRMARMVPLFQDNDRVDRAFEQVVFMPGYACELVDMVRADHDRKRLLDPAEAVFQGARRFLDTGKVEPADPPHGKDEPGIEQSRGLFHRVGSVYHIPDRIIQGEFRAAERARDRLGMVPPGAWVAVLRSTGRAHREIRH